MQYKLGCSDKRKKQEIKHKKRCLSNDSVFTLKEIDNMRDLWYEEKI